MSSLSIEGGLPETEPELGPDGDLVAAMVTTAVIPRLCKLLVGGVFDPYSSKHLKKAIDVLEQIEMCVDRTDPKFLVRTFGFFTINRSLT